MSLKRVWKVCHCQKWYTFFCQLRWYNSHRTHHVQIVRVTIISRFTSCCIAQIRITSGTCVHLHIEFTSRFATWCELDVNLMCTSHTHHSHQRDVGWCGVFVQITHIMHAIFVVMCVICARCENSPRMRDLSLIYIDVKFSQIASKSPMWTPQSSPMWTRCELDVNLMWTWYELDVNLMWTWFMLMWTWFMLMWAWCEARC